jgi:hypothetical protein
VAPPPPVAAQAPAPPPADDRVAVAVTSIPAGAEVLHEGAVVGVTPCVTRLPRGKTELTARRDGFRPASRTLDAAPGVMITLRLEPEPQRKKIVKRPSRTGTINPFEH